jgi:uncharacterized membrane protein YraQ (UPF0718 family)
MKLSEAPPVESKRSAAANRTLRWAALLVLVAVAGAVLARGPLVDTPDRLATFVTLFLGIFIEAVPFLLAGSIVSGMIEMFVNREALLRFVPRRAVPAALAGSLLGFAFPVCECGVVPVTRRLYGKGLPLPVGVSFLLAAPVVNPIVFFSTFAAFGWSTILWGRIALSIAIPFTVGLLFMFARPEEVLLPQSQASARAALAEYRPGRGNRLLRALGTAGDDFLDMNRYLVIGSLLAAAMQTLVPQRMFLALGENTLTAVATLMVLAFVLSVCSTVDAFIALAFVNSFPPAAILAFLVFGPMVDIKSALMFLGVFRRRTVLYLVLLPLLLTLAATLFLHLQIGIGW